MTTTVTAHEADRRFPDLLGKAEKGETVVITRDGKPVAQLVPCSAPVSEEERERAWGRLLEMARRGFHLGGEKFDRQSLYEDR
jgi:prevent-host-death family protein